jgi:hypothetical protein
VQGEEAGPFLGRGKQQGLHQQISPSFFKIKPGVGGGITVGWGVGKGTGFTEREPFGRRLGYFSGR